MIGNERVAALHDRHGEVRLAAIHRLFDKQAINVLAYLSGRASDLFDAAMEAEL